MEKAIKYLEDSMENSENNFKDCSLDEQNRLDLSSNVTKDFSYYMSLPYKVQITRLHPLEGGGWWCTAPELGEAFMHGEGETPEEAYRDMLEKMPELLQIVIDLGKDIPEPISPDLSYMAKFAELLMDTEDSKSEASFLFSIPIEKLMYAGIVFYYVIGSCPYFRAFFYNMEDSLAFNLNELKDRSLGMEKFELNFKLGANNLECDYFINNMSTEEIIQKINVRFLERELDMQNQKKKQFAEKTMWDDYQTLEFY